MLQHVPRQIALNQAGIPAIGGQQSLHPVGSGISRLLRQLPAVLAFHRTQQSSQIVQHPAARLRPPEPSGNALVYSFYTLCPSGHFRHIIPMLCHSLTSSTLNCLNSTRSYSATVVLGSNTRNATHSSIDPKPKPRWDVHLQYIGDWAGILEEIPRPLIAGGCGSGP